MMKCFLFAAALLLASTASASVFMPSAKSARSAQRFGGAVSKVQQNARNELRLALRKQTAIGDTTAMAIPGYGVAEQVFVGGFSTFLGIYNTIITARILLSWFPQAASIGLLQPVYAVTDPYLNLFRGLIPPIFGLDLSPILAFFLLSVLSNATAAVGAEIPPAMKQQPHQRRGALFGRKPPSFDRNAVSMNY